MDDVWLRHYSDCSIQVRMVMDVVELLLLVNDNTRHCTVVVMRLICTYINHSLVLAGISYNNGLLIGLVQVLYLLRREERVGKLMRVADSSNPCQTTDLLGINTSNTVSWHRLEESMPLQPDTL